MIITAGLLLALMVTGCDSHGNSPVTDYKVTYSDATMHHDSATLLVLEEDYGRLRVCGSTRFHQGSVTFTGQTSRPQVALIRWDNDTTQPFYFVLEGGDINITINPGSWTITGSPANGRYLHYINQRTGIINARVATWQEYLNMAADSTLRRDDEMRMARQDSLLNDSLQRLTVDLINRRDAVGRIIAERYGNELYKQHRQLLK